MAEKALEKDTITRVLKYDRNNDTAGEPGICTYLDTISETQFSFDEEELEHEIYRGILYDYLHREYSFNGYIFPTCQRWGERLKILKEFRDYLKEEISNEG